MHTFLPKISTAVAAICCGALLAACGGSNDASGGTLDQVSIDQIGTVKTSDAAAKLLPADLEGKTLRVVTSAPYPPFESFTKNNELEGLDIDLARAIGAKLGVKVSVESIDFAGIVPAVQAGRYDLAMAGMADTKDRQEVFNFIDYAAGGSVPVVLKGNPEHIEGFLDLCAKKIGVEQGTTFDRVVTSREQLCADAGQEPATVAKYPTQAASLLALRSGEVSALMTQATSASILVQEQSDKFEMVEDPEAPSGYPEKPGGSVPFTGIAVPRKNDDLFKAVYAAMKELGEDKFLNELFEKWGIGTVAVVPPLTNQASE